MGAEGDSGFYKATEMMNPDNQFDFNEAIGSISLDTHPHLIVLALSGLALCLQKFQFLKSNLRILQGHLKHKSELFAKSEHAKDYDLVIKAMRELANDIQGILEMGYG